jgi:hypothetical protein
MTRFVERKGDALPGFEWVQMDRSLDLLLPREAAADARVAIRLRAEEAEEAAKEQRRVQHEERLAEEKLEARAIRDDGLGGAAARLVPSPSRHCRDREGTRRHPLRGRALRQGPHGASSQGPAKGP